MKFFNLKIEKITWKDTLKKWLKRVAIFFGILIIAIAILTGFALAYNQYYANKIFPGVHVNGIKLSGMGYMQALELIDEYVNYINENGITYIAKDKKTVISPVIYSTSDPDLVREVISFDVNQTIKTAYEKGRGNNFILNFLTQMYALITRPDIKLNYTINKEELLGVLNQNFSELENPANQAKLEIKFEGNQIIKEVKKETLGTVFNYDKALNQTAKNIETFNIDQIKLEIITDYPIITVENSTEALGKVDSAVNLFPIKLTYEDKEWLIDKNQASSWITLKYSDVMEEVILGLKQEQVNEYLKNLSAKINIEAKEGKFDMEGGKVKEFQGSKTGKELNIEQSYIELEKTIFEENKNEMELIVDDVEPAVTTESINEIGIKEIIGIGHSDFSGSPANRRHNIRVGANTLHGLLIKPGEEFSLVQTLGDINAATGYLPELVIKGNETKPEYGGGLCQIGTTMFRVCLDAGLPITERKPHSYRVSYYEPAGMDATIYNPSPDLKCINDTGNYLLLQTRIEGNNLYFEFWGTNDGRKVEITDPKIWNITSPPAMKEIKTTDLEPGQRRCTEGAHNGADTVFYRYITYADPEKEKVEEEWFSRYRAWQAVCLIGVTEEELAAEQAANEEDGGEGGTETEKQETSEPANQPTEQTQPSE